MAKPRKAALRSGESASADARPKTIPLHETPEAPTAPSGPVIDMSAFEDEAEDVTEDRHDRIGDLLTIDPLRISKLQKDDIDTHVSRIRIEKWMNGRKSRIPGEFPPDQVTAKFLRDKYGPGIYEVKGVNGRGQYIGASRVNLEEEVLPVSGPAPTMAAGLPMPPAGVSTGGLDDRAFMQQMILALIARPQPAAEHDSMRDAVSSIIKLIALQVQVRAQGRSTNDHPPQLDPVVVKLLDKALTQSAAPARASSAPSFAEMMPILNLGLGLGARMHGGGPAHFSNPDEPPGWLKMVPELADTVGVPLILSLAQGLLPADKAKQLVEAVTKHMDARQAEAAAAIADEEPDEGT